MEKETILDLYYGKINPLELDMLEVRQYREHSERFRQDAEKFAVQLSRELKAEFERLCREELEADEILHRDGFCKGFALGLRLAAEALTGEK